MAFGGARSEGTVFIRASVRVTNNLLDNFDLTLFPFVAGAESLIIIRVRWCRKNKIIF